MYCSTEIHTYAIEEEKTIPSEYCEVFGEDGCWVYNKLVAQIINRDKHCLSFVDICFRVRMERLSEAKREHSPTCAFPQSHNCEVYLINVSPTLITVDETKTTGHKRTAISLRKR